MTKKLASAVRRYATLQIASWALNSWCNVQQSAIGNQLRGGTAAAHTHKHTSTIRQRESESEPAPVEQHPNAPGHSSSSSTKKTIQIVKGIQYDIQQQQKQQQRTEPGRESKPILWSDPIRYDLRKFRSRRRRLNAVAGSFFVTCCCCWCTYVLFHRSPKERWSLRGVRDDVCVPPKLSSPSPARHSSNFRLEGNPWDTRYISTHVTFFFCSYFSSAFFILVVPSPFILF